MKLKEGDFLYSIGNDFGTRIVDMRKWVVLALTGNQMNPAAMVRVLGSENAYDIRVMIINGRDFISTVDGDKLFRTPEEATIHAENVTKSKIENLHNQVREWQKYLRRLEDYRATL